MNRNKFLFSIILTSCLLTCTTISPEGFGSSFGGGLLGGFAGSFIGQATMSQPRQPRGDCCYQQPVQTRVVEVHKPTYIQVKKPKKTYREEQRNLQRIQQEEIAQQKITDIKTQAEQRTALLQKNCEDTIAAQQLDKKMKDLELKEKELELKKAEAELAKTHAENERLKLELQKLQIPQGSTAK